METILKYPGAKQRIAGWIIENMPEHEVYLEPYFGSGAVFFSKRPVKIETLNDIDGDIYNYFYVIRNNAAELTRLIEMTPYSQEEYEKCFIENSADDDPVERARKFVGSGSEAATYIKTGLDQVNHTEVHRLRNNGMFCLKGYFIQLND